jgi:Tfp pilus assembly protein PilN
LERREETFAKQLEREQALQASQTEQITTMAAQNSALLAAKQELTASESDQPSHTEPGSL